MYTTVNVASGRVSINWSRKLSFEVFSPVDLYVSVFFCNFRVMEVCVVVSGFISGVYFSWREEAVHLCAVSFS